MSEILQTANEKKNPETLWDFVLKLLTLTDTRMPINNFILDHSQQSNHGRKGQLLPKHLLSGI